MVLLFVSALLLLKNDKELSETVRDDRQTDDSLLLADIGALGEGGSDAPHFKETMQFTLT